MGIPHVCKGGRGCSLPTILSFDVRLSKIVSFGKDLADLARYCRSRCQEQTFRSLEAFSIFGQAQQFGTSNAPGRFADSCRAIKCSLTLLSRGWGSLHHTVAESPACRGCDEVEEHLRP